MNGVLKPLEEEMRMSESIFLPNGVAIISSFNLFSLYIHLSFIWLLFFTQLIHKQWMEKCGKTTCSLPSVTCSTYTFIPHSTSPSLCVIYLSVCGRIDSLLYSRPLKPGGDSPCQAAGSNEKLKEHINSSIWGHEDENSCQRPARNNWSHNAALLYVSEVMGVKQQLKTQVSENTESWQSLIGALH